MESVGDDVSDDVSISSQDSSRRVIAGGAGALSCDKKGNKVAIWVKLLVRHQPKCLTISLA